MKKLKIGSLEISKFCLGGASLGKLPLEKGVALIENAIEMGINIFDAHHRYERCEEYLGFYTGIIKMTKVSAYKVEESGTLVGESKKKLGSIDIFWISDLDNEELYAMGVLLYKKYKEEFPLIGITTESPRLALKFMREFPECLLLMVPVYLGSGMEEVIKAAKNRGVIVFAIKTLCDGLSLSKYGIKECVDYVTNLDPEVVVLGSKDTCHIEEQIFLYERGEKRI